MHAETMLHEQVLLQSLAGLILVLLILKQCESETLSDHDIGALLWLQSDAEHIKRYVCKE